MKKIITCLMVTLAVLMMSIPMMPSRAEAAQTVTRISLFSILNPYYSARNYYYTDSFTFDGFANAEVAIYAFGDVPGEGRQIVLVGRSTTSGGGFDFYFYGNEDVISGITSSDVVVMVNNSIPPGDYLGSFDQDTRLITPDRFDSQYDGSIVSINGGAFGDFSALQFDPDQGDVRFDSIVMVTSQPECTLDGDCDNDVYCDGVEICSSGECIDGSAPCSVELCDEGSDSCDECVINTDCDDNNYCNGQETCTSGACVDGSAPCAVELCDEGSDSCDDCTVNADCDDGNYCNGVEVCSSGECIDGSAPCALELCDEAGETCDECVINADCDDNNYCNGQEACTSGECIDGSAPCAVEICDEAGDICADCATNAECDDGNFCNGEERCSAGGCTSSPAPCKGNTPVCDEGDDLCMECLNTGHCKDGELCEINVCVQEQQDVPPITEVKLKGLGELDVGFASNGIDIKWIDVLDTTETSSLIINAKVKDRIVRLDELNINGSLKALKAKKVVLVGEMTATGGIASMKIAGTEAGSSIEAPWIRKLSVVENFEGDMALTGSGSPPKDLTLGKLSIKGKLDNAELLVSGNVGSVKIVNWRPGSILAVGVDPGSDGQFFTADDVATGGWIKKLKYKEYKAKNDGRPFGVIADQFLKMKTTLPFRDGDFCIWEK